MSYAQIVAKSLIELNDLKKTYFSQDIVSTGLVCPVKRKLIECYFTSIEDLIVLISSYSQIISQFKKPNELDAPFELMKNVFYDSFFYSAIYGNDIPIKIFRLFNKIMRPLEELFFHETQNMFMPYIGFVNGEKKTLCSLATNKFLDLAELGAFTLSGLRIQCLRLCDTILDEPDWIHIENKKNDITGCGNENCNLIKYGGECIHIFLTEEMYKTPNYFEYCTDLIANNIKNPEILSIIIDYKLIPALKWTKENFDREQKLQDIFAEVIFVNCNQIDFGEYINDIIISDINKLKGCILEEVAA